jgi:filamentous hemagglutinin
LAGEGIIIDRKSGDTGNPYEFNTTSSKTFKDIIAKDDSWNKETEMLTQEGAAIVAVAATVLTGGVGAGAATTITSAAATAATATAATIGSVNLINNKGNIGRAVEQKATKDNLENVAIAGVSGGLTAGVTNIAGGGQINNAVSRSVTQASVDSSLRGEGFQDIG